MVEANPEVQVIYQWLDHVERPWEALHNKIARIIEKTTKSTVWLAKVRNGFIFIAYVCAQIQELIMTLSDLNIAVHLMTLSTVTMLRPTD